LKAQLKNIIKPIKNVIESIRDLMKSIMKSKMPKELCEWVRIFFGTIFVLIGVGIKMIIAGFKFVRERMFPVIAMKSYKIKSSFTESLNKLFIKELFDSLYELRKEENFGCLHKLRKEKKASIPWLIKIGFIIFAMHIILSIKKGIEEFPDKVIAFSFFIIFAPSLTKEATKLWRKIKPFSKKVILSSENEKKRAVL